MPELPEVETVRLGLLPHLVNQTISSVTISHPRAIRRHLAGPKDFTRQLSGKRISNINRRGKFIWMPFNDNALIIHLGMSGQCLIFPQPTPAQRHERIRMTLQENQQAMLFVDQRTFGGMQLDRLVRDKYGLEVPASVSHIALDPFDPNFDLTETSKRLRTKQTEIKRALLDQGLISGIGNIYADEALWLAKLHPRRQASSLTAVQAKSVLLAAAEVMQRALAQGGTSFDSLYVNVNGESGYFARDLNAYGRANQPCPRCGRPIRREKFTNRSSHLCPRCQRAPKR